MSLKLIIILLILPGVHGFLTITEITYVSAGLHAVFKKHPIMNIQSNVRKLMSLCQH